MSVTVKAGWLKDKQGNKLAPKTYFSQVQADDGTTLEEALEAAGSDTHIIDVIELPTENINENIFYRLMTGVVYWNGIPQNEWICKIVETLPETGDPLTTDMVYILVYYNIADGTVVGYVDDNLSSTLSVPAGWYPVDDLAQASDINWGGIFNDVSDDPMDNTYRLLLGYDLYQYKDKWVNLTSRIGWSGTGTLSEIFNSLNNKASGYYSHAEGFNTTASGEYSHAEGFNTTASSDYSHAEGNYTTASGIGSHAEGTRTTAIGEFSHAEGSYTIAFGRDQHVQGRFNVENINEEYAHIVGNGTDENNRSNAHTLDWDGNAWYAGTIKVGGTSYRDASEVALKSDLSNIDFSTAELITVDDIDAICGTTIQVANQEGVTF